MFAVSFALTSGKTGIEEIIKAGHAMAFEGSWDVRFSVIFNFLSLFSLYFVHVQHSVPILTYSKVHAAATEGSRQTRI